MITLLLYFILTFPLVSQILPTVPKNVFRISLGTIHSQGDWTIENQNFNMNGIGRRYFNNGLVAGKNDLLSNYDLYHLGSTQIDTFNTFNLNYLGSDILDTANTVEDWLIKFNTYYENNLPTLGEEGFDTNKSVLINGLFDEAREKIFFGKQIKIEYGMSDEITISLSSSIYEKYSINQSFSNYSIGKASGVESLIEYHINAKTEFQNFINSNNFNNLHRDIRSTLNMIYDYYYRSDSPYSVNWVFHSLDDPLNNLIVDDGFKPFELADADSLSLDTLVAFYYPKEKISSGIDDITIAATVLLNGEPAWKTRKNGNTFYGIFKLIIPYGSTISPYARGVSGKRSKQFSEVNISNGTLRGSVGFMGDWKLKYKKESRFFLSSEVQFGADAILNTPAQLFSGGHTRPDSILKYLGNTYKYNQGIKLIVKTGGEVELRKNRFLMRCNLNYTTKAKERYLSKSNDWDNWMESHKSYTSALEFADMGSEFWILNSVSSNRIGPISFDIYLGLNKSLISNNIYEYFNLYSGLTTYFQGW